MHLRVNGTYRCWTINHLLGHAKLQYEGGSLTRYGRWLGPNSEKDRQCTLHESRGKSDSISRKNCVGGFGQWVTQYQGKIITRSVDSEYGLDLAVGRSAKCRTGMVPTTIVDMKEYLKAVESGPGGRVRPIRKLFMIVDQESVNIMSQIRKEEMAF